MNKYFNSLLKIMWVVLPFSIAVSCTDAWDTHYSTNQNVLQNKSKALAEKISEYGTETDLFVQALKNTMFVKGSKTIMSYYDYLSTDQVFTVWVPLESSISQEDWAEYTNPNKTLEEHIKVGQRFLNNHIARYSYSIGYDSTNVRMLSKKLYVSKHDPEPVFAEVNYKGNESINIPCKNGLVHFLNGSIVYRPTIYEYITEEDSYKDNLGKFFLTYTVEEIDEERSVESGLDENGEPIYADSVTYKRSILMDKFGYISEEDSNYTVILPTAEALKEMYDSIVDKFDYSYSKYEEYYNDSLQNYMTYNVLLTDMFFNMNENTKRTQATSTLYKAEDENSGEEVLHKYLDPYGPDGIFRANVIDTIVCSNGQILITDKWSFDPDYIYNRTVKSEAETDIRQYTDKLNISLINFDRDLQLRDKVSGKSGYNIVASSGGWYVTHDVINNLKGDYKVGVVIVNNKYLPGVSKDRIRPFKFTIEAKHTTVGTILSPKKKVGPFDQAVNFSNSIYEVDENGNQLEDEFGDPISKPVDTVWIANQDTGEPYIMSVPQCDYDVQMSERRLTITITSSVTISELSKGTYTPTAVIDCILLEPVSEEN